MPFNKSTNQQINRIKGIAQMVDGFHLAMERKKTRISRIEMRMTRCC
jgi:hypothetical protein